MSLGNTRPLSDLAASATQRQIVRVPDFDACSIFIYACSGDVVRVVYFCDRVVYFFARVVYLRRVCSIHARVPDSIPRPESDGLEIEVYTYSAQFTETES